MKKKLLAIVAVMTMAVTMIPSMVFADSDVAKIGDVGYSTLQDAINAANGSEIDLIANINYVSDVGNTKNAVYSVPEGVTMTLDLNGHTITAVDNNEDTGDSNANFYLFDIVDGTMTVKDSVGSGKITLEASNERNWNSESAIFHNRGGVLNIDSGYYEHLGGTSMAYVVDNSANYHGDANLTVSNGTLKSAYTAIRMHMSNSQSCGTSIVDITGGYIYGDSRAVWGHVPSNSDGHKGILTVSGGTLDAPDDIGAAINIQRSAYGDVEVVISGDAEINCDIYMEAKELKITDGIVTGTLYLRDEDNNSVDQAKVISGGIFSTDVSAYLEEDAVVLVYTDDDDNTLYGVYNSEADAVAAGAEYKVGDIYYSEYDKALAAAEGNEENMTALARYIDFILLSPDVKEGDIIPLEQWYQTRIAEETSLQDALDVILGEGMVIPEYEGYTLVWSLADWDWDEANEVEIFKKYTDIVSLDTKVDIDDGSNYSVFAKWVPKTAENSTEKPAKGSEVNLGEGGATVESEDEFVSEEAKTETVVEPSEEPEEATDTGDSMNMALPIIIAGLALAAMAAVVATRKRQN